MPKDAQPSIDAPYETPQNPVEQSPAEKASEPSLEESKKATPSASEPNNSTSSKQSAQPAAPQTNTTGATPAKSQWDPSSSSGTKSSSAGQRAGNTHQKGLSAQIDANESQGAPDVHEDSRGQAKAGDYEMEKKEQEGAREEVKGRRKERVEAEGQKGGAAPAAGPVEKGPEKIPGGKQSKI
jgi:hypothetical protein